MGHFLVNVYIFSNSKDIMRMYRSIVLSGYPASGKSVLAARLSEKYGWPVYSMGNLWREKYREMHPKGEISFEEFWGRTTPEDSREMNEQAKRIFENGGIIGDSIYVSYLDRSICLLVFVAADIGIRADRVCGREGYKGMSVEEIRRLLEKRENDELKIGKGLFGIDYRDMKHYHVVINSGKLTVEQEVDVIDRLMESDGQSGSK
jgi:cytidylate kinase